MSKKQHNNGGCDHGSAMFLFRFVSFFVLSSCMTGLIAILVCPICSANVYIHKQIWGIWSHSYMRYVVSRDSWFSMFPFSIFFGFGQIDFFGKVLKMVKGKSNAQYLFEAKLEAWLLGLQNYFQLNYLSSLNCFHTCLSKLKHGSVILIQDLYLFISITS